MLSLSQPQCNAPRVSTERWSTGGFLSIVVRRIRHTGEVWRRDEIEFFGHCATTKLKVERTMKWNYIATWDGGNRCAVRVDISNTFYMVSATFA